MKMRKIKKTLCALAAIAAIGGCLKTPSTPLGVVKHDVDQVFRDERGYRVYFDMPNGEVIEKSYTLDSRYGKVIKIFKDLESGTQGFIRIEYKNHNLEYDAEIHLSKDQGLRPGIEQIGLQKHYRHDTMKEIK